MSRFAMAPALLVLASVAAGAAPDLSTDRPDQTEAADLVPAGYLQLEVGVQRTEHDLAGDTLTVDALPQSLLRIGLSERFELRLGFGGFIDAEVGPGVSTDGASDTSLGVKIPLRRPVGDGPAPSISLIAGSTLPTGARALTSNETDPAVLLAFAQTLSERLSLGYNVGVVWNTTTDGPGDEDTLSVARGTVALGIGASDRLGFFVELFGESGLSANGTASTSADAGLVYAARPNLQLDLAVGAGLSDAAPDRFATIGLTYRWPD